MDSEFKKKFYEFRQEMLLFKGRVESEIGNHQTIGNINRHFDTMNKALEAHADAHEEMKKYITDLRIDMALNKDKISRNVAMYGTLSNIATAIITALIINYLVDTRTPRKNIEKTNKDISQNIYNHGSKV